MQMRKSNRLLLLFVLLQTLFLLVGISAYANTTSKPSKNKVVLPTPVIGGINSNYNKNEEISFSVFTVDYTGNVQYRVILNKIGSSDSINITKGYSKAIKSSAIFKAIIPEIYADGKYRLTVFAKIANAKVDAYKTDTKILSISKDIILDKNNEKLDLSKLTQGLSGNIYVKANDVIIQNVKLQGSIVINAGKNSNLNITNTVATSLHIGANGISGLKLDRVTAQNIIIDKGTNLGLGIEVNNGSQIANADVNSKVSFKLGDRSDIQKFSDIKSYSNLVYNKDGSVGIASNEKPNSGDVNKDQAQKTTGTAIDISKGSSIGQVTPPAIKQTTTETAVKTTGVTVTTTTAISKPTEAPGKTVEATKPSVTPIVTPPAGTVTTPPVTTKETPPPETTKETPPVETKPIPAPPVVEYAGMLLSTSPSPVSFVGSGYNYSMDLSSAEEGTFIMRLCITVSENSTLTIKDHTFNLIAHSQKQIRVLTDFGMLDNPPEGAGITSARAAFGSSLSLSGQLSDGINAPIQLSIDIKLK